MNKLLFLSPWPATEPAIQQARLRADESLALADARALGGRVVKLVLGSRFARTRGPGHGEWAL
ncbi:MAG TPA: hypothetical protein VNH44_09320 [Micropepsaceae bacterium]|nr:hypothetical protein [Micropepsaceae bacterium]